MLTEIPISELKPLQIPAHSAPRPTLRALSDDELLEAARDQGTAILSLSTPGQETWRTATVESTNYNGVRPIRTVASRRI